jgi:acetolactate synthase-1/3 small subunit
LQVRCTASQRGELRDLVQIFRLGVIDVAHTTMTLEVQGREDKMSAIADLLEPYGEKRCSCYLMLFAFIITSPYHTAC